MKLGSMIALDMRFQFRYGFYFLYFFLTLLYCAMLAAFPPAWQSRIAVLLIFSDPAAIGLFFMGAIVLYEKSERVLDSLAVSPVSACEYIISKLVSLALVSTLAALCIGGAGSLLRHPLYFILAVFFGSCLFSALGLMVAVLVPTLNAFILAVVPFEIVINIPAVAYIFGWRPSWILFHPGVSMVELFGAGERSALALAILVVWTLLVMLAARGVVKRAFETLGGIRL